MVKNFIKILFLLILTPSLILAQEIKNSKQIILEGTTGFYAAQFKDENGIDVIPDKIWFVVENFQGGQMHTQQTCDTNSPGSVCTASGAPYRCCTGSGVGATCGCDISFFGATQTAANMNLRFVPRSNKIENSSLKNGKEPRLSKITFRYPKGCLDTAFDTTMCKYGVDLLRYETQDIVGLCVDPSLDSGVGRAQEEPCP